MNSPVRSPLARSISGSRLATASAHISFWMTSFLAPLEPEQRTSSSRLDLRLGSYLGSGGALTAQSRHRLAASCAALSARRPRVSF